MEREKHQRSAAQKVHCYRKFHLSGDLSETIVGKVAETVSNFESPKRGETESELDLNSGRRRTPLKEAFSPVVSHIVSRIGSPNAPYVNKQSICLDKGTIKQTLALNNTSPPCDKDEGQQVRLLDRVTEHEQQHNTSPPRDKDGGHQVQLLDRVAEQSHRDSDSCDTSNSITAGREHVTGNTSPTADLNQEGCNSINTHHNNPDRHHSTNMAEELKAQLEEKKKESLRLEKEMAEFQLRHELELEEQKQKEKRLAMEKLKTAREEALKKHTEPMDSIQKYDTSGHVYEGNEQLEWLKKKLALPTKTPEEVKAEEENRQAILKMESILEKQKYIIAQAEQVKGEVGAISPQLAALLSAITTNVQTPEVKTTEPGQHKLMEQLRLALENKDTSLSGDWQKDALKQFLVNSNKITGPGGATTLKPELLRRLNGEEEEFSMADWLARLNKQEQGESAYETGLEECKHGKVRSGILDKATNNIVHKEVWPQKNLMEDWADEDMDFTQLQFEHHIAGEVRTI